MSVPWMIAVVLLWLMTVLLGVGFLGLVRLRAVGPSSIPDLRWGSDADLADIAIGDRPEPFTMTDADGAVLTADDLAGRVVLLTSQDCDPCQRLLGRLDTADEGSLSHLVVALDGSPSLPQRRSGARFVPDPERRLADAFGAHATPLALQLDAVGTVRDIRVPRAELADLTQPSSSS